MKAKISKNEHYVRLDLSGHISYESLDQLKEICHRQFQGSRLVFNLENLKFVGSSGITDFVGLLKCRAAKIAYLFSTSWVLQSIWISKFTVELFPQQLTWGT